MWDSHSTRIQPINLSTTNQNINFFTSERPCVDANNKLGEFLISGCERAKAGVAQVEVTFALDANGILNVTARDKVSPLPSPRPRPYRFRYHYPNSEPSRTCGRIRKFTRTQPKI